VSAEVFTPKQLRNIGEAALTGQGAPADASTDPYYQSESDAATAAPGEHRTPGTPGGTT
jgi:hypothetical protein